MILKTERLLLRPMTQADAPALFAIRGDAQAMRFWDRPALPRLATVEALLDDELAAMAAGGFFYWTVLRDGDAIGGVDLSHNDGRQAWIGFLFRRDVWGQGLAREAVGAAVLAALADWKLDRLMARIQTGNDKAVRLVEALGFQREGPLPDIARDGETRACALFTLNRSRTKKGA